MSSAAPSWLGLPDLAELLPSADAQAHVTLAARAAATAVALVTSRGEQLAHAGEELRCAICQGEECAPCE